MALIVLGFVGHFGAWALPRSASGGRFGLTDVVVVIAVTFVLMVVHELVHGLALLTLGHRPTFGLARVDRVVVGLTTTAPGVRMSRRAFDYVALAPLVLLTSATLSWAAYGPMGGAAVVPGAIHLGGCVGDLALVARASRTPHWPSRPREGRQFVARASRTPQGSLIEDRQTGLRIHPPENTAARGHRD